MPANEATITTKYLMKRRDNWETVVEDERPATFGHLIHAFENARSNHNARVRASGQLAGRTFLIINGVEFALSDLAQRFDSEAPTKWKHVAQTIIEEAIRV